MKNFTFDQVARSERYFTASLLPHLLMSNEFDFLKKLFIEVYKKTPKGFRDDFEIVSELDPIRDPSVVNPAIKEIFNSSGRVAVPDLFLRWDKWIILIEAKFFTFPHDLELDDQIDLQKWAIEKVKNETKYSKNYTFKFCLLTNDTRTKLQDKTITIITWSDVLGLLGDKSKITQSDLKYSYGILEASIKRALSYFKKQPRIKIRFRIIPNIDSLIKELPDLIQKEEIFVGFSGGLDALKGATLQDLETRSHYKVSKKPWSDQWLPIHLIIQQFLRLKNKEYEKACPIHD